MTQKERDNILLNIFDEQKQMKKEIGEIKKEQREMKKDQKNMQKEIGDIKKEQREVKKKQEEMQSSIDSMNSSMAVIEHVHGEKLQILLDVITGHIEKFEENNKRIKKCENQIDIHTSEIFYLKEKVQGL